LSFFHFFLYYTYIIDDFERRKKMKRLIGVLLVLLPGMGVFGQLPPGLDQDIGMPRAYSEGELKALVDSPRVVPGTTPGVKELPKDRQGLVWISTISDTEMVTAVPIDKIYKAINDFPNYAKNFENSQGAEVLKKTSDGVEVKAAAGSSKLLSISYIYVQLEPVNTPGEHLLVRLSDKGDSGDGEKDIQNMNTQYYLKTVQIGGQNYTYMRDRDYTEYRKMAMIGNTQVSRFKSGDLSGHLEGLKHLADISKNY